MEGFTFGITTYFNLRLKKNHIIKEFIILLIEILNLYLIGKKYIALVLDTI